MYNRGFTLVELAIVLLILGLLTSGILAGTDLIRASELRTVTTELDQYKTATFSFREKYMALPGDMANATQFWGVQNPTPSTCAKTASPGLETCDGNGNNKIDPNGVFSGSSEIHRFWQHLANAGMIEGHYTGTDTRQGDGCCDDTFRTNSPENKSLGHHAVWTPLAVPPNYSLLDLFEGSYGNFFILSGGGNASLQKQTPIVQPREMWKIDNKIDDGKPGTGTLVTYHTTGYSAPYQDCTDRTDAGDLDSAYNLERNEKL
jgi:prepilin-type N-terminal cleavage/methylation domain-containing protein